MLNSTYNLTKSLKGFLHEFFWSGKISWEIIGLTNNEIMISGYCNHILEYKCSGSQENTTKTFEEASTFIFCIGDRLS